VHEPIRESRPFDQFHDQRGRPVDLLETVDLGDVRMVQRRQHLRFALQAREPIGIAGKRFRQDLDRHLSLQPGVARAIHLTHAAAAERLGDFVGAEGCPALQAHRMRVRRIVPKRECSRTSNASRSNRRHMMRLDLSSLCG
jgi:hypothetical protein